MHEPEPLHIACTFDERMVMPALALLKSIKRHHADVPVHVHMMHSSGIEDDVARIVTEVEGPLFAVTTYLASTDYGHLSAVAHYSKANFYRVDLMTRIEGAARCVYLDCDIVVTRDLTALRDTDLQGFVAAASTDYLLKYWLTEANRKIPFRGKQYMPLDYTTEVLGMKSGRYLNSGVMVVDLARWNAETISERVMAYCLAHPGLTMVDQDGINAILDGRYAEIDCRWNSTVYLKALHEGARRKPSAAWADIMDQWSRDPWVVHFTFESKPWEPGHYPTAFDETYWDYVMNSPFAAAFVEQYRGKTRKLSFFRRLRAKKMPARWRTSETRVAAG